MTVRPMLALASIAMLAACPMPDRAPEATMDLPQGAEPATTTVTPTPETVLVSLSPVGTGTASGEASIRQDGARVAVQLSLRDAPPQESLAAHIHTGSCAAQGGVAFPLDPVITDGEGLGTSVTFVDAPIATLADGNHYVKAHSPGETPGAPIACGDIPRQGG